jgi:DNA-binding NarL/FixJ family response regulator
MVPDIARVLGEMPDLGLSSRVRSWGWEVAWVTTLLVCDGSPLVREQFRRAVSSVRGVDRVLAAASEEEAAGQLQGPVPDLVLLDVRLPDRGGVQAVRRLRAVDPATRVLMLTLPDDQDRLVVAAVAAGARGYLRKDASRAEVRVAVGQALTEQPAYAMGRSVVGGPAPRPDQPALTERELDVLSGMCDGRSNAEIGRSLYLSEDTVKTHARRLFRKLGASDRAHAVALAIRRGLVR